jgi:membrane dipeptidase
MMALDAATVHARSVVVNGLISSGALPKPDDGAFDLPEIMLDGGVTAGNLTVAVTGGFRETAVKLGRLLRHVDGDDRVRIAYRADDIEAAAAAGEVALILGFQNTDPFEGDLELLGLFHRLGVRIVQLTYQRRNLVADGCGEPDAAGLSAFGRQVVRALNELGMLIDLSHTGHRSTMEAIELSAAPVAFTHVSLHANNPIPRNKTDEEIRAVAARGGVIGMNAIARLVSPRGRQDGASIDQFVDQIDHVVELVGIDHVGIGLDVNEGMTPEDFEARRKGFLREFPELQAGGEFPFENYYTRGLNTMRNTGLITENLVGRGYGEEDIGKVLGGNFLRVLRTAEEQGGNT